MLADEELSLLGHSVPERTIAIYQAFDVLGDDRDVSKVCSEARRVLIELRATQSEELLRPTLTPSFLAAFRPPYSNDERVRLLERWRKSDRDQQLALEDEMGWTLSNWLYWFEPENRHWFWHSLTIRDQQRATLVAEVTGWPFPWGALRQLFVASGAAAVTVQVKE